MNPTLIVIIEFALSFAFIIGCALVASGVRERLR